MPLLACAVLLAAGGAPAAPQEGPRIAVLSGRVRVLAGEAWLALEGGAELPRARADETLRLDWNARVRLDVAGAEVELRGPLEVRSTRAAPWKLAVEGRGSVRVAARAVPLELELPAAARLDVRRGVYWCEGLAGGAWRVGCDAGDPLLVRAPRGTSWSDARGVGGGESLRIVPLQSATPLDPPRGRKLAAPPWQAFAWPWRAADPAP